MKNKTEIDGIIAMFNDDYGTDIEPRLKKLNEELNELKEALYNYFEQAKSGKIDFSDITDEMGDVLAVMTHVCSLIGTDPRTLFFEAVDKIKRRKTDLNYKRTHPHIKGEVLTTEIDWEQRRYEIAKDMIAAFLSNPNVAIHGDSAEEHASDAVLYADALIAELKKGGNQ